jgi:hypothetical protein
MDNFNKRAAFNIAFLILLMTAFALPETALARDPYAGVYDAGVEAVVGGEPGEDPHLRVTPIEPVKDSGPLGATPQGGAGDSRYFFLGAWEEESGPGSRVNRSWRLILQMWLWTLQR